MIIVSCQKKKGNLKWDSKMFMHMEQAWGRLELSYDIPRPFSTAIWKIRREQEQKYLFYSSTKSQPSPSLPLASSTSCTFGNMLTGYLKAVNCSENFTYWVMGHVCLIKIQLLHCTILGNLSSQVMKYDEIGEPNWFSMGTVSTNLVMINSFLC